MKSLLGMIFFLGGINTHTVYTLRRYAPAKDIVYLILDDRRYLTFVQDCNEVDELVPRALVMENALRH